MTETIEIIPTSQEHEPLFVDSFVDDYFDTEEEAREHFKDQLEKNTCFLLFVNSELAGFFDYIKKYSHDANYLSNISVNKEYRGKGYSRNLLEKYIEISKREKTHNNIALSSTHKTNITSQRMHIRFGFKEIGVLEGLHYGEDEIFYAYKLE